MANEIEMIIMQLITNAGDARSYAIEAIRSARKKDFDEADCLLVECEKKMIEAHQYQTNLIFSETNGTTIPVNLLMVHAQDHVMNAMTVKDMAVEMVSMMKELANSEVK